MAGNVCLERNGAVCLVIVGPGYSARHEKETRQDEGDESFQKELPAFDYSRQ